MERFCLYIYICWYIYIYIIYIYIYNIKSNIRFLTCLLQCLMSCYQTWKKSFKKLSQGRAVVEFILTFSLFYIIDSNFTDLFFSFSQDKLCMPEKQGTPQMFCTPKHNQSAWGVKIVQSYIYWYIYCLSVKSVIEQIQKLSTQ